MSDESQYALKQFKKALKTLHMVVQLKKSNVIVRDATIQRFEFTFELLWKTLRLLLEDKGISVSATPSDALRAAFKRGWIQDEDVFLEMLKARNKMSHAYNEEEAKQVYKEIKKRFLKPIDELTAEMMRRKLD